MKEALDIIVQNLDSVLFASQLFHVPKDALSIRAKKLQHCCTKPLYKAQLRSKRGVLSEEQERMLVDHIVDFCGQTEEVGKVDSCVQTEAAVKRTCEVQTEFSGKTSEAFVNAQGEKSLAESTPLQGTLNTHVKNARMRVCDSAGDTWDDESEDETTATVLHTVYPCKECGDLFLKEDVLNAHLWQDHKQRRSAHRASLPVGSVKEASQRRAWGLETTGQSRLA
ncbi:uncharacterized protein [Dermacentor andersoni]|uniref:uncharacterized protein isoform X3 n=1 Tax=Dermacentor andersoni TaxID=34620 RepID=UPI002417C0D1|nr:uncharacterized protein LOC126545014 isoform X3 [Dermacentor andersoni]